MLPTCAVHVINVGVCAHAGLATCAGLVMGVGVCAHAGLLTCAGLVRVCVCVCTRRAGYICSPQPLPEYMLFGRGVSRIVQLGVHTSAGVPCWRCVLALFVAVHRIRHIQVHLSPIGLIQPAVHVRCRVTRHERNDLSLMMILVCIE